MNILFRLGYVAGTMLLMVVAIAPPGALAQTPQEQDAARRLQQNDPNEERLRMNDNARRMQQSDSYGQPHALGQGGTPGYQRAPGNAGGRDCRDCGSRVGAGEWLPSTLGVCLRRSLHYAQVWQHSTDVGYV